MDGHQTASPTTRRIRALGALTLLCATALAAPAARAQSGIQVTPDAARTLVSKDVGGQRWAITRNPDGTVTGNVFSPDGGAPQFVWCEQTSSSAAGVGLSCSGAGACLLAPCDAAAWIFIAQVTLPESFFAAGASSSLAALLTPAVPSAMVRLALATTAGVEGPSSTGLQRTPDGARTLLSKDVGDQRWAISRNEDGTVTGNVFFPGGGEPQFVWCEQTGETRGDVALRCLGASACARDGGQGCAPSDWKLIAEVSLPLEFFLPSEVLDENAFAALIVGELGEDGAFAAVALALERGYSLEQIVDAALEKRLRASGEIVLRSGATEPPSGPARDLFSDEPAAAGAARPSADKPSLSDFLAKFEDDSVGFQIVIVLLNLIDAGYSIEQILVEFFFADSKLGVGPDARLTLVDGDGEVVKPDGPPRFFIKKCGNGDKDEGEDCDGADIAADSCAPVGPGPAKCSPTCEIDRRECGVAFCGDGRAQGGEQCDGSDVRGKTCADVGGLATIVPTCTFCTLDYGVCGTSCASGGGFCCPTGQKPCGDQCIPVGAPCCGDGQRQGSEQCDGADLGGATCASQGQGSGTLRCTTACGYDASDCTGGGTCGSGTFACEGGCAPNGADCCEGEQGYCAPGTVCVGDNTCCPSGTPKVCGNSCLPTGASCCGNGAIEAGEACDGAAGCDPGATCSDDCTVCTSPAVCGNGVREGSELCDGPAGCGAGQACSSDCDACNATATCGNGVREGSETCDPPGSTSSCGAGEVCGADCASCVSTTSCAGRCCAGRNDSCTPPGVGCYCDQYCVEAGDCCGDFGASCG